MLTAIGKAGLAPIVRSDAIDLLRKVSNDATHRLLQLSITSDSNLQRPGKVALKHCIRNFHVQARAAFKTNAAAVFAVREMNLGFTVNADWIVAQILVRAV